MSSAAIVLDANILIRAVLGTRVRALIQTHASKSTALAFLSFSAAVALLI